MWAEKPTIKEGPLLTKDGKQKLGPNKWKSRHVRLVQGHILVFKKSSDSEPSEVYLLSECVILRSFSNTKKDNTFGIETDDETRLFSVENKDGFGDWVKQLELLKQQCPASTHDDAVVPKQKKATLFTKAKKNITGKVVSSSVGRDALKSILDEETRENFNIFKQLLVSEFGEEKASVLESDMIKLVVKGHFAYENGLIDTEELPKLQDLLKKCCYLLTGAFPMTAEATKKQVLDRAVAVILEAQGAIEKTMKPALTPKNFAKIGSVFACIGSSEFMHHAYMLEKNKTYAHGLNEAMRKFLLER
jgi:hypothetical protein